MRGDLVELLDPKVSLPWLDQFEGCSPGDLQPHEYRRETISVECSGGTVQTRAYVWNLPTHGLEYIDGGDWVVAQAS